MTERGDIAVARLHNLKNEYKYALGCGKDPDKIIQQVIKQEKDLCKQSIFLAIDLNNLIDYETDIDYSTMMLKVTARLRECVSPEKMKEIRERELLTNIRSEDNAKSD